MEKIGIISAVGFWVFMWILIYKVFGERGK